MMFGIEFEFYAKASLFSDEVLKTGRYQALCNNQIASLPLGNIHFLICFQ